MSIVQELRADSLKAHEKGFALHDLPWRFHTADGLNYGSPANTDSNWTEVKTMFSSTNRPKGWNGSGWFRLWFKVDEQLTGNMLALRIVQSGASEVYLDGKKIGGTGIIGATKAATRYGRTPFSVIPFMITDHRPHLLAVRYVNDQPPFPEAEGFQLWVSTYGQLSAGALDALKVNSFLLPSISAQLALVLLHMVLFAFYPRQRLNLYYSLFVFSTAAVLYLRYLTVVTGDPHLQRITADLFEAGIIMTAFLAGVFLYAVSNDRFPRRRMMIMASWGALTLVGYLLQNHGPAQATFFLLEIIYFLVVIGDGLFALVKAMIRKKPRIWLVGMGMLILTFFYLFVGSDILGLMKGDYQLIAKWMSIGVLAVPVSFSVYLALDFADINRSLTARLKEVQELSDLNLAQEIEKGKILASQAERLEKTVTERTLEVRSQAQKLQEMDALKSRFMVNLTHEFRTPLSLIIGPAGLLAEKAGAATDRRHGELIMQNAQQLLRLINQLLDLSKLEEGKMEIAMAGADILAIATAVLLPFNNIAMQKQVGIELRSPFSLLHGIVDEGKLTMILRNLVSNAIKFSLVHGEIIVTIDVEKDAEGTNLIFMVADQGIGIPANKLPYVFDRFYQADTSDTRSNDGSGIGLALTRELVELLGGMIYIDSTEHVGTTVQIKLPVQNIKSVTGDANFSLQTATEPAKTDEREDFTDEEPLLLVIEDHDQLREFISATVGARFRTLTARNGEEGFLLTRKHIPDLVITDLMMPGMDGYAVCSKIKLQELTSHIPVMMLTAKNAPDSRIKGWEAGADAYLSKPFEPAELLALADGLIRNRIQLLERYRREEAWKPASGSLPPQEVPFIEKVRKVIEAQLDNELFGVDMLCDVVGLSRAQLHRKLKSTIGYTPGELIRMIRLQQALQLLRSGELTAAEIAYKVGFSSPASFSTSFSNYFGYAPRDVKDH
jgi:signal transduction histidine kinase/CheY-like chemotaxis protein